MKKIVVVICCVFAIFGCNSNTVEKPKNLIGKDKMVDILYDMSLLEAIKNQNIDGGVTSQNANDYIYKKYKIDSIQFVKSSKYYGANIAEYQKMIEKVKERLSKETLKVEDKMKKEGTPVSPPMPNPNPDAPQVQ